MKFLGIGEYHSLGAMYLSLMEAGHEVRVYVEQEEAHGILRGMVTRVDDWRAELPWIRAAGADGIIVFESACKGALQDGLRRAGYHVIGGSALGDRLESDRAFGQATLRASGLATAPVHAFTDYAQAIARVRAHPQRYVYKHNGSHSPSTANYVGELPDGADIIALLEMQQAASDAPPDFVLMEHVSGVEVGVGAYFNGTDFLAPACLDWEHKRFFPGDLGELTPEMGTVVTYRGAERLFAQTLAPLAAVLRAGGYCGYINVNTIVNRQGIWPLEFTCRFGYPGFAICAALHREEWGVLLHRMAHRSGTTFPTRAGYAVGVVLTVPPFPHEYGYALLSKGTPVFYRETLSTVERSHLHYGEVEISGGRLVTSGSLGYVMVATGTGSTVPDAQRAAYELTGKVVIANLRYRTDIGTRLVNHDLAALRAWGWVA